MGLLNLKTIGIVFAIISSIATAAYFKGCSDGKESGREEMQSVVDEWRGKYQNLRDQPPKVETRTITKYIDRPARTDRVASVPVEETETPLETPRTSVPYTVDSPGTMEVTFIPLASAFQQFVFDWKPAPMRVDTVYVTETKTALEYVEVSIFEQAEFYVLTVIAAVGGYALAGGF